MKKLSLNFLLMLGLMSTLFFACGDDDAPDLASPTVTNPAAVTVEAGASTSLSFSVSAPAGYASSSVAVSPASAGTATVTTPPAAGATAGAATVTFTAGAAAATATVTLTVTDSEGDTGSGSATVTVNLTATPVDPTGPPAISAAVMDTVENGSLTVLSDALEATALFAPLAALDKVTIFAPNNAAFTALLKNQNAADLNALVTALTPDVVTALLQSHVVADSLGAAEADAAAGGAPLPTLNSGATLAITKEGNNLFVNGAQIIATDIKIANGVIHIIDSVVNLPTARIDVGDASLVAGETYNWTSNNEYFLTGLVYVEDGAVLNIQEGTTVRFTAATAGDNTSALIIAQGGQINAIGTATDPIIFTSEDDIEGANLLPTDWGKWGGLIVLGSAPASKGGVTSGIAIEGINSTETRGVYGGTASDDNSGTLQYVSIRYTGVGIAPNSEIQGLTLGGVGSGTTIDHIDIYSSADDGIEIFGGTVDISYISVAFATDDSFDFDEGWVGSGQFLFALQTDADYDQGGEWDGAVPDDAAIYSAPNIYNATFVGPGQTATGAQRALIMRDAFAGKIGNSIFEDFPGVGVQVEDIAGDIDSYARLQTATAEGYQVEILNNTWARFGGYVEADGLSSLVEVTEVEDDPDTAADEAFTGVTTATVAELADNSNNYSATAVLTSINRTPGSNGLDPRPAAATQATTTVPAGLTQVPYRGAFAPGEATWLAGWSTLAKLGILVE